MSQVFVLDFNTKSSKFKRIRVSLKARNVFWPISTLCNIDIEFLLFEYCQFYRIEKKWFVFLYLVWESFDVIKKE